MCFVRKWFIGKKKLFKKIPRADMIEFGQQKFTLVVCPVLRNGTPLFFAKFQESLTKEKYSYTNTSIYLQLSQFSFSRGKFQYSKVPAHLFFFRLATISTLHSSRINCKVREQMFILMNYFKIFPIVVMY